MPKLTMDYPRPASTKLTDEDFERLREMDPDANVSELLRRAIRFYITNADEDGKTTQTP